MSRRTPRESGFAISRLNFLEAEDLLLERVRDEEQPLFEPDRPRVRHPLGNVMARVLDRRDAPRVRAGRRVIQRGGRPAPEKLVRALFAVENAEMGLVASLARPGGNVAGIAILTDDLEVKNLDLLEQAVPSASRVAVLSNPENPIWVTTLKRLKDAAPVLRRAAEMMGPNAAVHYHLGMTYYRLGQKSEAAASLRRSLQLDDRLAEADQVRQVLRELGR